jgi:hypothetical protein
MAEVIVTESELKLAEIFSKKGLLRPIIGCTFCFKCNRPFLWLKSELPDVCKLCKQKIEYGMVARPDILLINVFQPYEESIGVPPQDQSCRYSVVRVQGGIHYKNKKRKEYDRFQLQKFLECDIPVFDIKNEEIDYMVDNGWPGLAFVTMVEAMTMGGVEGMYARYKKEPEVKARMFYKTL